ncbi:MAG: prolipoprotein diacylglyceryl transferase [Planctomycetota bacterium]|jgi:phosphatidylglycerol:prolipoprotein diacylglycerol transferase|nr:prolipoprotein diacylglyceryl transferase [Planctomycetota bacterium]
MMQTLFHIPNQVAGVPLFGWGLLLALVAAGGLLLLAWLAWRQGLNADTLGYLPLLAALAAVIWFVLPRICEPEGLPIRGYGTLLLAAILAAIGMTIWRGRRLGLDPDRLVMLCFWMILPGIVGARVFYVIEYWEDFQRATVIATIGELLNFTEGGLVVYGSIIGGIAGLLVFLFRHKMPLLATLDLMTPSFMLGLALGRLGCFMNGCCFGGPCDLPWAVEFPAGSPVHVHQMRRGEVFIEGLKLDADPAAPPIVSAVAPGSPAERHGLDKQMRLAAVNGQPVRTSAEALWVLAQAGREGGGVSVEVLGGPKVHWTAETEARAAPVHPTQIYAAINALLICLLLVAYAPFRRRDGEVFALFLTVYPLTRFIIEVIRNDEGAVLGTGLTISQNVSLVLLAVAAILWILLARRPPGVAFPKWEPPPASPSRQEHRA